ncbi:MAG: glycerol-3-phosphate dehydrogenase/oxidase [Flavobacteriales bacterium]
MNRTEAIKKLKNESFDLLVIGGGITGVGIALDAQMRGLKTAVIEMQDFASGTSSRSTKLIHGGLRYLKQFEFRLVNEVGRERAIVHKIAPHLVHPDKMLLPLIKDGNYGYLLTNMGLSVYDFLAGVEGSDKKRMLNKAETEAMEPLLRKDILEGGGYYAEYRTDDARLVMGIARTAWSKGTVLSNYVKLESLNTEKGRINGCVVKDLFADEEFSIKAKQVVNATGPWVDGIREKDGSLEGKRLFLSKGIHLVVDHEKFPIRQTVYFDNEDGRMVFAIPRGKTTYFGTTDTAYEADKEDPLVSKDDAEYAINAVNYMFPDVRVSFDDIRSSWAGLRPLIHEDGKDPSQISRKDEIFESTSGLISIAGGKLTGYRKMAERVVDLVAKNHKNNLLTCQTESQKIIGGEFDNYQEVQALVDKLFTEFPKLISNFYTAEYLVHNYGTAALEILRNASEIKLDPKKAIVVAEVNYTCKNEMCMGALDFFERRTGRVNFDTQEIAEVQEVALKALANFLNWEKDESNQQEIDLVQTIRKVKLKLD